MTARALLIAAVLASTTSRARADEPTGWKADPPRWFVAGELDGGALLEAAAAAGFGQPYWAWLGAEARAITTAEFGALYAGLRGKLPFVDATVGVRWTASYDHPRLPIADTYDQVGGPGDAARYLSLDASVVGYAPVPRGYAMLWIDLVRPLGQAADTRLFEEYERVVIGPGSTIAARLAYLAAFDDNHLLLGPALEHVWIGGRDAASWRLGGALSYEGSPRWGLDVILTVPVAGRDRLGWWDGLWGSGAVHYRWATP
jgi:hypothetical protein